MNLLVIVALLGHLPEDPAPALKSGALNLKATWRWNRGTVQAVVGHNGRSYAGSACAVLTVRDSTLLSRTDLPGIAQDLVFDRDTIYVAAGFGGLQVLSLANPDAPEIVGSLDLPGYAWSVNKEGGLVLVASGPAGLSAIDVSTPGLPRLVASLNPAETVSAVAAREGLGYLACGREGCVIIDCRNPRAMRVIARLPLPGTAQGVALKDSFAFFASPDSGVIAVSVARPSEPAIVGRNPWPGALNITIAETNPGQADSLAAISCGPAGLFLVNVANPLAPWVYSYTPAFGGYIQDASFSDTLLQVAAGPAGLRVYGIRNPVLPALSAVFSQPGYIREAAVRGETVWVTSSQGLYGLDLRGADLGHCHLPRPPGDVVLDSDWAVVALADTGLAFVNIADAAQPVLGLVLPISGKVSAVAAGDSWVWVGTADSGLQTVSVAVREQPRCVAHTWLPPGINELSRFDTTLLAATVDSGIYLMAVARPRAPAVVGRLQLPGRILSVSLGDGVAVAGGDLGLFVIDVAQPADPRLLCWLPLAAQAWKVVLADTLCYVAEDWAGLVVFDIRLPDRPQLVGYYAGPSIATSLVLAGQAPIAVDRFDGLSGLAWDLPAGAAEPLRPDPGLYCPPVVHATSFSIVVPAHQSAGVLKLVTPSGRTITSLPLAPQPAAQSVLVSTEPLGAGLYFARFESRETRATAKAMVIR